MSTVSLYIEQPSYTKIFIQRIYLNVHDTVYLHVRICSNWKNLVSKCSLYKYHYLYGNLKRLKRANEKTRMHIINMHKWVITAP